MKKKNILFVHHSPSENTKRLSKLVENKIETATLDVNLTTLNLIEAKTSSFKEINGLRHQKLYLVNLIQLLGPLNSDRVPYGS